MHLHPFHNQYPDQDLNLIADAVRKYYPVDGPERLNAETVMASPGFKKLGEITTREFLDDQAYHGKWGKLTSGLKKALKKTVHGHPDLHSGGFFGEVIIERKKKSDFIRQKSLWFYVSNVGPFFSIHGVDSSIALLEMEWEDRGSNKGNFPATHAITISPAFEYLELFNKLEDELRSFFPGYSFVPYCVGMSTIENISVEDVERDSRTLDTIYEAIFGVGAVHSCPTRGDQYYGLDDWNKPFNEDEKSLIDLISQHIITPPRETTVHKVWSLREWKQLDSFRPSGNLMLSINLFDVIDLTDKSKLIMVSKGLRSPASIAYKIIDQVIDLHPNYSLRIVEVTKDSLTLHLILNFKHESVSRDGGTFELNFIEMKKLEPGPEN